MPLASRSLVQITASSANNGTEKAKFWVTVVKFVCFGWGDLY